MNVSGASVPAVARNRWGPGVGPSLTVVAATPN